MSSLNKVMLIGNLGKDPEARTFDSGVNKTSFSLATAEKYTNKEGQIIEQTEWHNIEMWRGLATTAEKYLRKGHKVFIEGRLRTRSWDDDAGNKRYMTFIEARSMVMLTTRAEAEAMAMANGGPSLAAVSTAEQLNEPAATNVAKPKEAAAVPPPAADDEDDLPF